MLWPKGKVVASPIKTARFEVAGYAFGLGSGLGYGALNIVAKTILDDFDVPPVVISSIALFFGAIMLFPLAVPELGGALLAPRFFLAMFALSGVAGGIGVIMIYSSLERADVVVVSPIIASSPLISLILARVFLQRLERIPLSVVLGTLLVVGGTVLVVVGGSI